MKFKATLSDRGLRVLERGFLPTLEKLGKRCQLLLSPEDVHLIQGVTDTDGLQVTARLANAVLFEEEGFKCQSRYNNQIAFSVDIALLLKVLRSAVGHDADALEMKLAMRSLPCATDAAPQQRPTLAFSWRGHNVTMVQELPISQPFTQRDVEELCRQKDITSLSPFYLDLQDEVLRTQALTDKLKGMSSELLFATTRHGDLHLQVHTTGVEFGSEVRGLSVLPAAQAEGLQPLQAETPEERLEEAREAGESAQVVLLQKHLARALHSSQLTLPAQLLCGIAERGAHVHFMFVYRDPLSDGGYDDNVSLSYKLPVREDAGTLYGPAVVGSGATWPAGRHGICGDPAAGPLRHEVGGSLYTGRVAAWWTEGSVVNMTVTITAFHKGRFGLRICRIQGTDAASEKAQLTEDCLNQNVLRQAAVPGAQAPGDPYYHLGQIGNAFTYRVPYQLPQNLTCDGQTAKCVIQWHYLTGNSCDPPGEPAQWSSPQLGVCGAGGAYPEEAYYQCTGLASYYLKCPTGLLFNDQQMYCDWRVGGATATAAAAAPAVHPHSAAIEQLSRQPPQLQLPPRPEPPGPLGSGKSEYVWVARPSHLAAAAAELFEQDRIALDVEHHNVHSYAGMTCLLQLSTGAKDFLIDCLALKADMQLLDPVLSNPRIMKVVHGGGNDVLWLQRDFGLFLVNVFDTEKACQVLGFRQRSLAYLLQRYCAIKTDKNLGQRADWRQRPLPPELLVYARRDVRHLLFIADCLGQELLAPPQHKAKHEEEQQLAAEAAASEAPALAAAAAAAGLQPASPRAAASTGALESERAAAAAAAGSAGDSSAAECSSAAAEQQGGHQQASRRPRGGEVVELVEPPAGPPPSIVQPSPEAQLALEAAMAVPQSRLERAVFRSQALTLTLHQPTPPATAVAAAASALMRRHVAAALEQHARLTPAQVNHLETVADCVHALASWRDAAARQADEGLQCLLPDAELLRLAEAAAASVAPESSNLRGRAQRMSERQLLELLPPAAPGGPAAASGPAAPEAGAEGLDAQAGQGQAENGAGAEAEVGSNGAAASAGGAAANGAAGSCGCWPAMLRRNAAAVASALSEAAAGQRPWVCPEVQELLRDAAAGGTGALGKQSSNGGGSNKAARRRDPAAFRQRQAAKFAAKNTVYENCQMFSQDGELLCHTDRRKLEWYLKKGLAEKVSDDPLSVRLTFQHQTGDQQAGTSEFYSVKKSNQCVACGEQGHYLRYRVVPSCYRRAMPVRLKSHRSHDIVLLCVSCHELAHAASEKLKRQVAQELGVPLLPPLPAKNSEQQQGSAVAAAGPVAEAAAGGMGVPAANLHPYNVRKSALAYQRYGQQMPEKKRRRIEAQVRLFLALQAGAPVPQPPEPAAGEEAAAADTVGALSEVELYSGLLVGLGKKTRKRQLKRWVKQGKRLPPELATEAAGAAAAAAGGSANGWDADTAEGGDEEGASDDGEGEEEEGEEQPPAAGSSANGSGTAAAGQSAGGVGVGPADLRNTGHLWHGNEVVRRLEAEGGEDALLDLCRRFRECFVSALQPQYLPPGWSTVHQGMRAFGSHSIYSKPGAN
ncbi:DNA damage checkpoint isoform A [Chlorella sorokiniana]|uniref:DNA damage checkpoint isoform A n=1 Tax=Chlorella sorokiniana TaxID=3076 RepID=A0A2P6TZH3_CHLSO|nr:DNA damage checkpoint isoform C [Chlorella sorokiniana]PRW59441.1 DNA damage checkpoint isoform A [Chlorella sorokiniana]|eukprot:PRW59440.1 DNA damage checkpoint isoform C [Chlorella sorokiniana]